MISGHISSCRVRALCGSHVCGGVGSEWNFQTHLLSFLVIFSALWLAAVIDPFGVSVWEERREQNIKSLGGNCTVVSQFQNLWAWLIFQLILSLVGAFTGMPEAAHPVARLAPDMDDAFPLADCFPLSTCCPGIQFTHDPSLLRQDLKWF